MSAFDSSFTMSFLVGEVIMITFWLGVIIICRKDLESGPSWLPKTLESFKGFVFQGGVGRTSFFGLLFSFVILFQYAVFSRNQTNPIGLLGLTAAGALFGLLFILLLEIQYYRAVGLRKSVPAMAWAIFLNAWIPSLVTGYVIMLCSD